VIYIVRGTDVRHTAAAGAAATGKAA